MQDNITIDATLFFVILVSSTIHTNANTKNIVAPIISPNKDAANSFTGSLDNHIQYSSIYGAFSIFKSKNDNPAPRNAPKNYGRK